ncbi:MAG: aminoglycoside phosphotransferase family protein [Gammaproteobacteria bacterium]
MPEDLRTIMMRDWLEHDLLLPIGSCEPASSDASFRRYFRVRVPEGQFIVMDAPPEKENIAAFIKVAELLQSSGVHVPFIYEQNPADGFLLLEDFGNQSYLDRLNQQSADSLYRSAFDTLFKQQADTLLDNCGLPSYDEPFFERELAIFDDWFLGRLLGIEMPGQVRESLHALLIESAMQQPRFFVHRDFHSRNLMVLDEKSPGVIDFQDAVIGPVTYDLVSLLRDCYIAWPEDRIEQWMAEYYRRLVEARLIDCSLEQFRRWFDLMGMQRHLKAIGIFSRLKLRDAKPNYLKDIPRTLSYVVIKARAYPELSEFSHFLESRVLPLKSKIA